MTKPPKRAAPKIVYDKKFKEKRLQVTIDRHNWIAYYGSITIPAGGSCYKYYSNLQAMCSGVQRTILRVHAKALNPESIRNIVDESERYVADMAGDIKRMFEETPFATPEERRGNERE